MNLLEFQESFQTLDDEVYKNHQLQCAFRFTINTNRMANLRSFSFSFISVLFPFQRSKEFHD